MDADVLVDDEFHARQPDAVIGQHGAFEREVRIAEIEHHLGARLGHFREGDVRHLERHGAFVHMSDVALCAGNRDDRSGLESLEAIFGADDCGNSHLPRDDGRVTGPAAAIRDDAGGFLHDRLPVRSGRVRDKDFAGLKRRKPAFVRHDPYFAGRDPFSDCAAGDDRFRFSAKRKGLHGIDRALRRDSLGSRLHNIELPIDAVLGPFDVHGGRMTVQTRIVILDGECILREQERFRVRDAEPFTVCFRHRPFLGGRMRAAVGKSELELFLSQRMAQNRASSARESRLVNVELVGVHASLDDVLADPIAARDENDIAKARFRIEREDHTACRKVRSDHLHHSDGQSDFEVIEFVVVAIDDRAVREQGGEAAPAGFEHRVRAAYIDETLMLTGETGVGQIFRDGRAANGDRYVRTVFVLKIAVGLADLVAQFMRSGSAMDDASGCRRVLRQSVNVIGRNGFQKFAQLAPCVRVVQCLAIGLGCDGESVRDAQALWCQLRVELAKRCGLAADKGNVLHSQIAEPAYVGLAWHRFLGHFPHRYWRAFAGEL